MAKWKRMGAQQQGFDRSGLWQVTVLSLEHRGVCAWWWMLTMCWCWSRGLQQRRNNSAMYIQGRWYWFLVLSNSLRTTWWPGYAVEIWGQGIISHGLRFLAHPETHSYLQPEKNVLQSFTCENSKCKCSGWGASPGRHAAVCLPLTPRISASLRKQREQSIFELGCLQ